MNVKEQVLEEYRKKHKHLPTVLYHYTSIEGLLGIIGTKSIWASDILYLNDKDEFHHTLNLLESKAGENFKGRYKNKTKQLLYDLFKRKGILEEFDIYVFSLSENGDLLSQWRGYCPHFGFSIGFDYSLLVNTIEANNLSNCILLPCFYDEQKKKEYVTQLFNFLLVSIAREAMNKKGANEDEFQNLFLEYTENIIKTASIFKSESFAEEREWRLFAIIKKDGKETEIKFRKGNSMIIPFIELNILYKPNVIPIKEIIVSPAPNQNISIKSTVKLINSQRIRCDVNGSKIPYRVL